MTAAGKPGSVSDTTIACTHSLNNQLAECSLGSIEARLDALHVIPLVTLGNTPIHTTNLTCIDPPPRSSRRHWTGG